MTIINSRQKGAASPGRLTTDSPVVEYRAFHLILSPWTSFKDKTCVDSEISHIVHERSFCTSMNDEQLLQALRNRQEDAFRQVVELHQHRVINICYRFVRDRTEAEDLAQETFMEVYRSVGAFRGQSDLSTWIHRIAVSKSLDFIRMQTRQKRGGKLRALLRFDGETTDVPAPTSTEPDEILKQEERKRVLQQALDSLPSNQRIAFVLSKYDGVSYQEIAAILKTSLSSVESLIHRAKKKLQDHLRSHYKRFF
jgi:RNA polymerase sigma-70 factor, ECF subfamily